MIPYPFVNKVGVSQAGTKTSVLITGRVETIFLGWGLGAYVFDFSRYEVKVLSLWSCDRSALETVVYGGVGFERVVIFDDWTTKANISKLSLS